MFHEHGYDTAQIQTNGKIKRQQYTTFLGESIGKVIMNSLPKYERNVGDEMKTDVAITKHAVDCVLHHVSAHVRKHRKPMPQIDRNKITARNNPRLEE